MLARGLDVDAGGVGGVGDVEHDRGVGGQREGARARAAEGRLLLHGGDRRELPRRAPRLRDVAGGLERHVGAEAVVERARDQPSVLGSRAGAASITATSPTRTSSRACSRRGRRCRCAGPRARGPSCAPRRAAGESACARRPRGSGPVGGVERDPLADEHLRVPAADFAEPQLAVVVDVGDDQADLVDMAHHQQAARALARRAGSACAARLPGREQRQGGVPIASVLTCAKRLGRPAPDGDRGGLVTGGSARAQQLEQQLGRALLAGFHAGSRRLAGGGRRVWRARAFGACAGRARRGAHPASSPRSTYGRMPPWRKYWASRGVSMRTRASNSIARAPSALGLHAQLARQLAAVRAGLREAGDREALLAGQPERARRSARPGTAAAARPCRSGWSGGCARSSRRSRLAPRAASCPWPPSRARSRSRTRGPASTTSSTPSAA